MFHTSDIYKLPYSNPYLSDYVEANGDTDPSNMLSDYKYYRGYFITGWTVS